MKRAKKVRNFLAATKFTRAAARELVKGGVSVILKKNMKFKLDTANEDKFFKIYILIDDEEKKFCFRIGGVEWAAISISLVSDPKIPLIVLVVKNKKGECISLWYDMVARGDVDNKDFDDIIDTKKNVKINSSAFPNSEEIYDDGERTYLSMTIYISQAQMDVIRKQYSDIHIDTRSVNVMDAIESPDQNEIEPEEPIGFDDKRALTRFDVWINRCQVYCINREYPEHNYKFQGNYRDIPGIIFYQEGNRIIMQVCFTYYIGDSNVESLYYLLEPVADDRPEFDNLFNGKSVSIEKLLVRTPKKYIQLNEYNYISCERLAVSQKQLDKLFDLINSNTPIETRLKDKTSTVSAKRENVSSMTGGEKISDVYKRIGDVKIGDIMESSNRPEITPIPIEYFEPDESMIFQVKVERFQGFRSRIFCGNLKNSIENYKFQGQWRSILGIVFYTEDSRIIMQICFDANYYGGTLHTLHYMLEPVSAARPEFDNIFNGKCVNIKKLLIRTPSKYIQLNEYDYVSCERLAVSQKQIDAIFRMVEEPNIQHMLEGRTSTVSAKRENNSSMAVSEKIFARRNDIVPSLKVEFSDSSIAVVYDGGKGNFVVENPDDKLSFCRVYRSDGMTEYYLKMIEIKREPPSIQFTVAGTLDDVETVIEIIFRESSDDYTMPTALHLIKNTSSFDVTPSDFSFKDSVYYDDEGFIVTLEGPYVSLDVLSEFDPIGAEEIFDTFIFADIYRDFYADENYKDSGKLVFVSIDPDTPAPPEYNVRVFSIMPGKDYITIGTRNREGIEITFLATLQVIRDDAEISDTFISELLNNNNTKHINLASLLMDDAIYIKKGFSYSTTGGPYITEHDLVAWVEKYGKNHSDKEENTVSAWSMIAGWFTIGDKKSVTRLKGEIKYEDITAIFDNTQNGFEWYRKRHYPDELSVSFDDDPEKALVHTIEIHDKKCIGVNLSYKSGDITILVDVDTSLDVDSDLIQKFIDVSKYVEDGNITRQVEIPISTFDILGDGFEYETKDRTTYKILNHKIPSTAKSWKIILERFIRRDVAVNVNDMLGF